MNRNQAKALLPIIQAYAEGKTIQSRCVKGDTSLWYDDEDPSFDDDLEYRIQSEPKFRPFKDAEECWHEMQKHQPIGWLKSSWGYYFQIVYMWKTFIGGTLDSSGRIVSNSYLCLYNSYTFADGIPFGVKVEE